MCTVGPRPVTSVEPGNRQNTQPRPGEAEAARAAEDYLNSGQGGYLLIRGHLDEDDVAAAIAAAYPVIAVAVLAEAAERIAADIDRWNDVAISDDADRAMACRARGVWDSHRIVAALRSELSGESSLGAGQ